MPTHPAASPAASLRKGVLCPMWRASPAEFLGGASPNEMGKPADFRFTETLLPERADINKFVPCQVSLALDDGKVAGKKLRQWPPPGASLLFVKTDSSNRGPFTFYLKLLKYIVFCERKHLLGRPFQPLSGNRITGKGLSNIFMPDSARPILRHNAFASIA